MVGVLPLESNETVVEEYENGYQLVRVDSGGGRGSYWTRCARTGRQAGSFFYFDGVWLFEDGARENARRHASTETR